MNQTVLMYAAATLHAASFGNAPLIDQYLQTYPQLRLEVLENCGPYSILQGKTERANHFIFTGNGNKMLASVMYRTPVNLSQNSVPDFSNNATDLLKIIEDRGDVAIQTLDGHLITFLAVKERGLSIIIDCDEDDMPLNDSQRDT